MYRCFLLLLFILLPGLAFGDTGTLIVTYQSGTHGERLDRIRFWLKKDEGILQLYPKKEGFLEDDEGISRKVVIENLPAGTYSLQFALPNYDGLFEAVPARKITIEPGAVVKIDQLLKTKDEPAKVDTSSPIESLPGLLAQAPNPGGPFRGPSSANYLPRTGGIIYNYDYGDFFNATVNIKPNLSDARWEILSGPYRVQAGTGDGSFISLPPNTFYSVQAEQKEGYVVTIEPQSFTPAAGENITVRIIYSSSRGKVEIQANMLQGETARVTLTPLGGQGSPISATLRSVGGQAVWKSPAIPTGRYKITYQLPPQYASLPAEVIQVVQGQTVHVIPQIVPGRSLRVLANIPNASYTLTSLDGSKTYQGQGSDFVFEHLLPGKYTLSFVSPDPQLYLAPKPHTIEILPSHNATAKVEFHRVGLLTITTNVPDAPVSITSTRGAKYDLNETVTQGQRSFAVPEGDYRVYFYPPRTDINLSYAARPSPIDVSVSAGQNIRIHGEYGIEDKANQVNQANQAGQVPQQPQASPLDAAKSSVEEKPATVKSAVIVVPSGEAIVGDLFNDGSPDELPARRVFIDSFKIGRYEVTNAEYVSWLNEALTQAKIVYKEDGDARGNVYDNDGNLLCKTSNADPNSQILISKPMQGSWSFFPLVGKENFPVINVTWHGAKAYCQARNGRLPTEAEWEKAAGMARTKPGMELKKFRYGTGTDTIERRQANYKDNDRPMTQVRVDTTEVGFYNGTNTLPLRMGDKATVVTLSSPSPYGAYDMSGNVWEWVNDWYSSEYFANMPERNPKGPDQGTQRVAKGGCYDSLADGVRVAERLPLPPGHADIFTGFRIAFD